jgi:hypothetical protein
MQNFADALHFIILKDFTDTLAYFKPVLLIKCGRLYAVQVGAVGFAVGTLFGGFEVSRGYA